MSRWQQQLTIVFNIFSLITTDKMQFTETMRLFSIRKYLSQFFYDKCDTSDGVTPHAGSSAASGRVACPCWGQTIRFLWIPEDLNAASILSSAGEWTMWLMPACGPHRQPMMGSIGHW